MSDYEHAFVFVDNHDNQRGHGGGGQVIVSVFWIILFILWQTESPTMV